MLLLLGIPRVTQAEVIVYRFQSLGLTKLYSKSTTSVFKTILEM